MGTWGYARLSVGRDSNVGGLDNQARIIVEHAQRLGIDLPLEQVVKEQLPAYKRGAVPKRPLFEALMAEAEAEPVAFTLICYDLDRLTRTLTDLDRLINVAQRGAKIYSVTRNLNLSEEAGQTVAALMTVLKRQEIETIRRRTLFRKSQDRAKGKFLGQGPRTFGYSDGSNDRVIVEDERDALRTVFERVTAGESWRSLADWLNQENILPPNQPKEEEGKPKPEPILWTARNLSKTFLSPPLYGKWVARDDSGVMQEHKADWEAIFTEEERVKIQDLRKHRRTYKQPVALKHYLSGVMTCGKCDDPRPFVSMGKRKYACRKCQNAISKPDVEHIIDLLILERLLAGDELPAADREPLDLSDLEAEMSKKQQAFDLGLISEPELITLQDRIARDIQQRREEYDLAVERLEVPEWLQGERLLETWLNGDPEKKREIALRIFQRITVQPFIREGQGKFQPERLDMVFRVAPHTLNDYKPRRTPKQPLKGSKITAALLHPAHFGTDRETQKELLLSGIRG
ncbi:recombinase family protein [Arsenicicoccus dermatophilus]|uniref:recombinase family protein n=1 Tax=Arsenicicoccus dermatophilus TaxID=1076331 RepID=UPI003916F943